MAGDHQSATGFLVGTLLSLPGRIADATVRRPPPYRWVLARTRTPEAEAARAAERAVVEGLIARLGAVDGVVPLVTQVDDRRVHPGLGLDPGRRLELICQLAATAYFATALEIPELLRRIEAAGVADWGAGLHHDPRRPHPRGSVADALSYYRHDGRHPDGSPRDAPSLYALGATLSWDEPGRPPVREPNATMFNSSFSQYTRDPAAAGLVEAARAEHGLVLRLSRSGAGGPQHPGYFTVPRGWRRRGR
ncbi:hypothetical protein GCM10009639_18740 [Kitasatospora putterlickiae]|uniref:Uncharacterized protein n=1 Tax=Kitasatospora putterlickiae TaxID=221725 RepID=A0ABN1XWK7_9ACTN